MSHYQEVPNPEDVPESIWDYGWRWWVAVFSAFVCVLVGLAILGLALALVSTR